KFGTQSCVQGHPRGEAKIVLHEYIPVVTLDNAIVWAALVETARLADEVIREWIAGHRTVESKEAVGCRGRAVNHFGSLELAAEFHGMVAAEPAHVVPELIDVAVFYVVQAGIQVKEPIHRHL